VFTPANELPPAVQAFDHAQSLTIQLTRTVVDNLEEGMSEIEVGELIKEQALAFGFTGWFHQPEVRFAGNISVLHRPSKLRKLAKNTLIELDIAPATDDAFGDLGVCLSFNSDSEPEVVYEAREACRAVCGFSSRFKTVGELFVFSRAWANNHRMNLGRARSIGHVVPLPEGPLGYAWPNAARASVFLRRFQVHFLNPRRLQGLWALAPRVVMGDVGMCFEEIIYIDGDHKRVLGRDDISEIGSY
jgi:Xaa-Pro aminopeptidase